MEEKFKKKIIEEWFPIETVGNESLIEKKISTGHISNIHQWHARRPVVAMRAVILGSLLDSSEDKVISNNLQLMIKKLCQINVPDAISIDSNESQSINKTVDSHLVLKNYLRDIVNSGIKALDPFAGGGSIPFELALMGCETYGCDLNPVAVLINKATVEFPVKFRDYLDDKLDILLMKYARNIIEKIRNSIEHLYANPINPDNLILYYIWSYFVICQNSKCNLEIPMFKSFILDNNKKIAILWEIPEKMDDLELKLDIGWPQDKKKLNGFYKKGAIVCPRCGMTLPKEKIHELFRDYHYQEKLVVICELNQSERKFRISTPEDKSKFDEINQVSSDIKPELEMPDRIWLWAVQTYGIKNFKEFFNERQYFCSAIIAKTIMGLFDTIVEENGEDLAKAIGVYLQFGLDYFLNYNSKYSMLRDTWIRYTWARPGLFMPGSYSEVNPFIDEKYSGSFLKYFTNLSRTFTNIKKHIYYNPNNNIPNIAQMDCQSLEFANEFFDLVITDPPYYDSIPYAADSDFYYMWDKITLSGIYPSLFISKSTPKNEELVADPYLRGNAKKAKIYYQEGMGKAFSEIYRVLKENGIIVIVFAHKKVDAWAALLDAFISSKFVITATWPVPMESRGKLGALTSASLTSVVLIVARKMKREKEAYFDNKLQTNIKNDIENRMEQFWNEGIRGADFFLSAIGPGLTHFSKYDKLLNPIDDNPIDIQEFLSFIQTITVNFAIRQITKFISTGNLDSITQFYLVWRWGYGLNLLPFDEVKKLYQALLIDFNDLDGKIVEKQKKKNDFLCKSPNDRFVDLSDEKIKKMNQENLIDYLQLACFLWEKDKRELLEEKINEAFTKYSDSFWMIAQALYDILPDCQEATQLQGLLQRYKKFKPSEKKIVPEKKEKQTSLDSFKRNSEPLKKMDEETEEEENEEEQI